MNFKINYALHPDMEEVGFKLEKDPENGGYDLKARISGPITLGPLERLKVPTGVYLDPIVRGIHSDIRPTSGLPSKHGIVPVTGLIDYGYRGELAVTLINLSNEPFTLEPMNKVAQLVFWAELSTRMSEVSQAELADSKRGDKGFGGQSGVV